MVTPNLYGDIMRRPITGRLSVTFLPLKLGKKRQPLRGLIASESESYKILHLFLMHVKARFDV